MATTIQSRIRAYYAWLKLENLLRRAAGSRVLQKFVRRELARLLYEVLKRDYEIHVRAATVMQGTDWNLKTGKKSEETQRG
jgi:hypothetical protein